MITQEEWDELFALKKAINDSPSSVSAQRMERFTELFVKTLPRIDDTTAATSVQQRNNRQTIGGHQGLQLSTIPETTFDLCED